MLLFADALDQPRSQLLTLLDRSVAFYRAQTFADSTKRTYKSQLNSYLDFCNQAGILPVPISQRDLACYIGYLARRLQFSSLQQYLNIVRILHEEAGLANPVTKSWFLSSLLRGVKRSLGDVCKPKLPITVDVLSSIFQTLNLASDDDLVFWAACLVAFFSFLRKSHLLPVSSSSVTPHVLTRSCVTFCEDHVQLHVKHSKTIQYEERVHIVPLARIPGSFLCPAQGLLTVFKLAPDIPSSAPLFTYRVRGRVRVYTYSAFHKRLRHSLSLCGLNPEEYAAHSFRRGGASLALACDVPIELVKLQGDWRSDAYQRYLVPTLTTKLKLGRKMAQAVACTKL